MEILLGAVMLLICFAVTWVLVIKNSLRKENRPVFFGLVVFMGIINGAILAGMITLVNLMQYHY